MTVVHTRQQWFDLAWARAQTPVRATDADYNCSYSHTVNGGCFIGCAMPTEIAANPAYAGKSAKTLVSEGVISVSDGNLDYNQTSLLSRLQIIHDANEPCDWLEDLRHVASDFGLTIPGESDVVST